MIYLLIAVILVTAELFYFRIARKCNIIDRPNERSSHTKEVTRGGGIIFLFAIWIWCVFFGLNYPWFAAAVTVASLFSFVDDNHSLLATVRLVVQFIAMGLMLYSIMANSEWFMVQDKYMKVLIFAVMLMVFVGATNIYNFMDGINGITVGYSMVVLLPLFFINRELMFVDESLIVVVIMACVVFGFFNFRPKGKAKCFAGDVGAIGIAFILLFMIGMLIMRTADVTWMVLLVVYGVDGFLTICHRIMLHENIIRAHRKHAYQLMANELKIGHLKVSGFYMLLQLVISTVFIWLIPCNLQAHWLYLAAVVVVLSTAYILFVKKYYYLHEEYLAGLKE